MDLFKKIIAKNYLCPILSKIDLTNVPIPKTYCKIYFLECNALSSLTLKILCWYIPLCNGWLEIPKRGSECGHYKEVRFRSQVLCNYVKHFKYHYLPLFEIPECNWVVQKLSSNVVQVWAPPFLKRSITKQHFHGMVGIETYGFKTASVYVLSKKKEKKEKKKETKIQRTKKGGNKNKNQKKYLRQECPKKVKRTNFPIYSSHLFHFIYCLRKLASFLDLIPDGWGGIRSFRTQSYSSSIQSFRAQVSYSILSLFVPKSMINSYELRSNRTMVRSLFFNTLQTIKL